MKSRMKIWIESDGGMMLFGDGKASLLEKIDELGSISKAAEAVGIDYKKVWKHIEIIERNINEEIVVKKKGGGEDSGTKLTPKGKELINAFREFRKEVIEFADKRFEERFIKGGSVLITEK